MTRQPLDSQGTSPAARALEIAPTDSITGHLRNALTILQLGDADFARPMGVAPQDRRQFDRATIADIETRILAALACLATPETAARSRAWLFEETDDAADVATKNDRAPAGTIEYVVTEKGRAAMAGAEP